LHTPSASPSCLPFPVILNILDVRTCSPPRRAYNTLQHAAYACYMPFCHLLPTIYPYWPFAAPADYLREDLDAFAGNGRTFLLSHTYVTMMHFWDDMCLLIRSSSERGKEKEGRGEGGGVLLCLPRISGGDSATYYLLKQPFFPTCSSSVVCLPYVLGVILYRHT